MDVGLCLPTTVHDAAGPDLVEFARRADRRGFSTLGVIDRVAYDNYDSIVALAAAAAVTERIGLATTILLAAARPSVVELAKQLASVDRLSGGRLTVGIAAGLREDDFAATGADYRTRGARLDRMIGELRQLWRSEHAVPGVGPLPARRDIPLWIGGHSPAGLRRAARHGIGWISPGGPPAAYAETVGKLKQLWAEEGRTGTPKMAALCYAQLGADGKAQAEKHILGYYSYMGPLAQRLAAGAVTEPEALRAVVDGYAAAGCDELMLLSCTSDPGHVDELADVVLS
ncbi:LLM class flavin-dependent oxidoreductase [Amycolatopsis sp. NPDC059021]|uniref:LLM class flavin-dependent oxidoreductase n=1 Tax=Amycolatopsis sp. NPDC059021 TaxID=3346704 RepID=UPI00367273F2